MERYQRTPSGCCGYTGSRQICPVQSPPARPMREAGGCPKETSMYHHADEMIPAMAYVPYQTWQDPFSLHYALCVGTIFPDLCKPFCGRRERCR